jgi:hypothetical protein
VNSSWYSTGGGRGGGGEGANDGDGRGGADGTDGVNERGGADGADGGGADGEADGGGGESAVEMEEESTTSLKGHVLKKVFQLLGHANRHCWKRLNEDVGWRRSKRSPWKTGMDVGNPTCHFLHLG